MRISAEVAGKVEHSKDALHFLERLKTIPLLGLLDFDVVVHEAVAVQTNHLIRPM